MSSWVTFVSYEAVPNTVVVDVTVLSSNSAIATFSGDFVDGTGTLVSASGTMEMKF